MLIGQFGKKFFAYPNRRKYIVRFTHKINVAAVHRNFSCMMIFIRGNQLKHGMRLPNVIMGKNANGKRSVAFLNLCSRFCEKNFPKIL